LILEYIRRQKQKEVGGMTDAKYMRPGIAFAVGKTVEELGELQAALGKTIRWGWASYNPELPEAERETNLDWVKREMQDVRDALDNLDREMSAALATENGLAMPD
jgi:hypothetical protein